MDNNVNFTEEELLVIEEAYELITKMSDEYHKLVAYLYESYEEV